MHVSTDTVIDLLIIQRRLCPFLRNIYSTSFGIFVPKLTDQHRVASFSLATLVIAQTNL